MALSVYIPSTLPSILTTVLGSVVVYLLSLATYRLYFHPLSHIPGPRFAAISYFYEFYWDVIQPGRLTWKLQDLHDEYGPILRLTPDEVHIRDSSYFDELYARSTGKRHKLPRFSGRFGFKQDCFSTWQHDVHRLRRTAINPFFSAQKATVLQPVIRSNIAKLAKVLEGSAQSGEIVPINLAYMALTGDIITTYAFDRSYNQLDSPGFKTTYDETLKALYTLGNVTVHFPIIFTAIDICPPWLTAILNPVVMPIVNFYADSERDIATIRNNIEDNSNRPTSSSKTPTIFHELLLSPVLPPHEKTNKRLAEEAVEIVAAGIITSSFALTVGTYHISTNPTILSRLQAELSATSSLPPSLNLSDLESHKSQIDWHTLETLPYLTGIVRESIRLSGGVITRAPRINPDHPTTYKSHTVPAGYAVSMTSYHVNHDPTIFPDPEVFDPTRWLRGGNGGDNKAKRNQDMDRWVVAFGKGPRQCAGINLAYAELYLTFAVLFNEFEFSVAEDVRWERDVRVSHAYMVPYPDLKSPGVGVVVRKRRRDE